MKVIDLLNKIANGKELPNKIKLIDKVFIYEETYHDYKFLEYERDTWLYLLEVLFSFDTNLSITLNTEIEIIEDTPKKIEKVELFPDRDNEGHSYRVEVAHDNIKKLANKIDEIIDYINKGDNNE